MTSAHQYTYTIRLHNLECLSTLHAFSHFQQRKLPAGHPNFSLIF